LSPLARWALLLFVFFSLDSHEQKRSDFLHAVLLLRSGVVQPDGEVQRRGVLEAVLQVDVGLVQVEQERAGRDWDVARCRGRSEVSPLARWALLLFVFFSLDSQFGDWVHDSGEG
jgi:hypothetical protein